MTSLLIDRFKTLGRDPIESSLFKRAELRAAASAMNDAGAMTPETLCGLHYADLQMEYSDAREEPGQIRIWDRYVYSSATSIRLRGGPQHAWRILLDHFPQPDLVVLLLADPAVCFDRIVNRAGKPTFFECGLDRLYRGERLKGAMEAYHQGSIPMEFARSMFVEFMHAWNQSLEELAVGPHVMIIRDFDLKDAARIVEDVIVACE
ncbi:hypothetical protein [Achromobacter spanius]|uniref:hypothetical protein n=1 Tax=Achromobacter spanius TaxID=217203 RepID=UPI001319FC65|nr:hypothetical protein [Achromobacter spanius]